MFCIGIHCHPSVVPMNIVHKQHKYTHTRAQITCLTRSNICARTVSCDICWRHLDVSEMGEVSASGLLHSNWIHYAHTHTTLYTHIHRLKPEFMCVCSRFACMPRRFIPPCPTPEARTEPKENGPLTHGHQAYTHTHTRKHLHPPQHPPSAHPQAVCVPAH